MIRRTFPHNPRTRKKKPLPTTTLALRTLVAVTLTGSSLVDRVYHCLHYDETKIFILLVLSEQPQLGGGGGRV